jgi:hypothetical protein
MTPAELVGYSFEALEASGNPDAVTLRSGDVGGRIFARLAAAAAGAACIS